LAIDYTKETMEMKNDNLKYLAVKREESQAEM
jgi:hypothetical protein